MGIRNFTPVIIILMAATNNLCFAASDDVATVTSQTNSDPDFQWTLEKMLMATAMPMTGEERAFLHTHKNLDGIRSWSDEDFKIYTSSDLGKKHVVEENAHWKSVAKMLERQAKAGAAFMHEIVPTFDDHSDDHSSKQTFQQMKILRQQIAILAPFVESMRKKAESKGCSQEFEKAIQIEDGS